jgi:hypothetical protein
MNSLYDHLKNIFDNLGPITIDQGFIDHREYVKPMLRDQGRTEKAKTENCDALILEYTLIQRGLAIKSKSQEHDFFIREFNAKVDAKKIESWFNIDNEKIVTYNKNYRIKELTHFCFFKFPNKMRPLVVGDTVKLEFLDVVSAEDVLRNVTPSNYKGYYYNVKNNFTYN